MPGHASDGADSDLEEGLCRPPRKQAKVMSKTCETCKAKKSRCDSSRPQCDTCRRKGVTCIYKEKGQPGLRPGYGKAVEGRLSLLEENMAKMSESIQDVLRHVQASPFLPPAPPSPFGMASSRHPAETDHNQTDTATSADSTQQHPVSAEAAAAAAWQSPASLAMAAEPSHPAQAPMPATLPAAAVPSPLVEMPVLLDSMTAPQGPALDTSGNMPAATASLLERSRSGLPPDDILLELASLFFQHIYPWAPLFHQATFRANMFAPERQLLLHGLVVLAFRFWDLYPGHHSGTQRKAVSPAVRARYIKTSRDTLLVETINSTALVAYQALALLAIDAVGDGPGPRTWNIMAMLVACARQLHLDRTVPGGGGSSKASLVDNEDPGEDNILLSDVEAEEKRRLFWTIYSLDRFSSVSLGQPSSIDSRKIKLQYPARDEDWGRGQSAGAGVAGPGGLFWGAGGGGVGAGGLWFQRTPSVKPLVAYPVHLWQHYIDILSLVDQSNHLLVQPVNLSLPAQCQEWQSKFRRLDILTTTWFENLPPSVREPPATFDPMWALVQATYHLINIRMYTVAAFPSTASPYLRPSPSARSRCRHAVEQVARLAASLSQPEQVSCLGPAFAFVVWVAARTLMILWTTGHETASPAYGGFATPSHETLATAHDTAAAAIPPDLTTLIHALKQSAVYWPCAQCYADILQLILDTKNNPGGPTGLDIFNDTRRTAYGLRSRLGTLASHRLFARDFLVSSSAEDYLDGVLAELLEVGPVAQLGLSNLSPEFDGDWL